MLRKLPASVVGLEFGALAGSPGSYDSPYGSPLHGSNLTSSQLITPVGSPMHTALGEYAFYCNCKVKLTESCKKYLEKTHKFSFHNLF